MSAKYLTPEQCNWMHQQFPPPNCCLCNSKGEIARLESEKAALVAALEVAEEDLEGLEDKLFTLTGVRHQASAAVRATLSALKNFNHKESE